MFELSDEADAVVRLVILFARLFIMLCILYLLWERRTPTRSLYEAEDDLPDQPDAPDEPKAEVEDLEDGNHLWVTRRDNTKELVTFMEDGESWVAQEGGSDDGKDAGCADSLEKERLEEPK